MQNILKPWRSLKKKKTSGKGPTLGHWNYDLPFLLFVHENKGPALGALAQHHGPHCQPVGYYSQARFSSQGPLPSPPGCHRDSCAVSNHSGDNHESLSDHLCSSPCGSLTKLSSQTTLFSKSINFPWDYLALTKYNSSQTQQASSSHVATRGIRC